MNSPDPRANVVLTGFMGTGKTTIGLVLAVRLGFEFVDTDAVIESDHGPIPEIFAEHGESHFRTLESNLALALSTRTGLVVSTGGGLMLDDANASALSSTGTVVCLTAEPATILERVRADSDHRPLLRTADPAARISSLLAERAGAYGRFKQVNTDERDPAAIVDEIIALL